MYVKRYMLRLWKTRVRPSPRFAHGEPGVVEAGHRRYVGGTWEEGGRIQFDFLRREGLAPHHVLLDIGCGSLRAGVHLIPYLDPGHYLGLDKEPLLVERAISEEFDRETLRMKKPQLVISSCFEFDRFDTPADYALAQSVFTHLPPRHRALSSQSESGVPAPPAVLRFMARDEASAPEPEAIARPLVLVLHGYRDATVRRAHRLEFPVHRRMGSPAADDVGVSSRLTVQPVQAATTSGLASTHCRRGGGRLHAVAVDQRGDLVLLLDRQLEVLEEGERCRVLLLQPGRWPPCTARPAGSRSCSCRPPDSTAALHSSVTSGSSISVRSSSACSQCGCQK